MMNSKCLYSFVACLSVVISMFLMSGGLGALGQKIQISNFTKGQVSPSSSKLPEGWVVKVWEGTPDIEMVKEHKGTVLKLRSRQSNVALYKKVQVDLSNHPHLAWEWKVMKLPTHGNARDGQRDDQAAGIYVVFPRFPEFFNTRIIGYVWESEIPQGSIIKSQNDSRVHYIVVRSGKRETGEWLHEWRNVQEDYVNIFGEKAPPVGAVSLMIDSDHTQSSSESLFGDIYFSSLPKRTMG